MPIDSDGVFVKRTVGELLQAFKAELREQFGDKLDLNVGSPALKLVEASVIQPLAELQNTLDDVYRQIFPANARGQSLDDGLELFGTRKLPARAEGVVNVHVNEIFTSPDPLVSAGDIYFVGTSGRKYNLIEDIAVPEKLVDGNQTGTASELIDATNTRIAQKFTLANSEFVQAVRVNVTHGGSAPSFDVKIETDVGDAPSGTLADANLSLTGFAPADGVDSDALFTLGANLSAGDYWVVFERTAGSGTFDGGTGGTADQVQIYTGSWANSANVENIYHEVFSGCTAAVRADIPGALGNAEAGAILTVRANNTAALNDFNSKADSFSNIDALEGGQDRETDTAYLARVRESIATRETSSLDGIVLAVRNVDGVRGATGIENVTDTGTSRDKVFDSNETGVASEQIGATNTRIAQKMVVTDERFVQHFNFQVTHVSGTPTYTVRLETDNSGDPSGTLAFTGAELTGFQPSNGTATAGVFDKGEYLTTGTYWLVAESTAGEATFDGNTGGTADQVKYYDGAWNLSTSVENLNLELIGGVPPHGFRIFASGGGVDDIAQAIQNNKSAGIRDDGIIQGTATNVLGSSVNRNFDRPTEAAVVVSIAVSKTSTFGGDEDTVRDAIVSYIGGTDTKGASIEGLGVADDLIRNEIITAVMDDIPGVFDVTQLLVGKQTDFATPAALTPSEDENLSGDVSSEFIISDPAADISVTLVDA